MENGVSVRGIYMALEIGLRVWVYQQNGGDLLVLEVQSIGW